jgi:hypothetical protein
VGTLVLIDTWSPEERTRLMPFGATKRGSCAAVGAADVPCALVTSAIEPSRLVHSSRPIGRPLDSLEGAALLARLEAVEWWRQRSPRRDFCAVWDGEGFAWVEVRTETRSAAAAGITTGDSGEEKVCRVRGWID